MQKMQVCTPFKNARHKISHQMTKKERKQKMSPTKGVQTYAPKVVQNKKNGGI